MFKDAQKEYNEAWQLYTKAVMETEDPGVSILILGKGFIENFDQKLWIEEAIDSALLGKS